MSDQPAATNTVPMPISITVRTSEEEAQEAYSIYYSLTQALPAMRKAAAEAAARGEEYEHQLDLPGYQPGYWLSKHYTYYAYMISERIVKLLRIDMSDAQNPETADRMMALSTFLESLIEKVEGLTRDGIYHLDDVVDEFFDNLPESSLRATTPSPVCDSAGN